MNNLLKNKTVWIIGLIVVVAGFFIVQSNLTSTPATEAAGDSETATAFIGDLSENATASGEVVAVQEAALSVLTSGVVETVHVSIGESVSAGDVLVELEDDALVRAVASAESGVRVAEAELAQQLAGPTDSELASAEASLASAEAALEALLAGPTAEEIAASQANVDAAYANVVAASGTLSARYETDASDIQQAEINLQNALDDLQLAEEQWVRVADCEWDAAGNATCERSDSGRMDDADRNVELARANVDLATAQLDAAQNPDSNSVASSQASVASSQASYDSAVARHEALMADPTPEEIAAAEADVVSAQATLDTLLAGARETDIETYEIRLAQAKIDLENAQNNLAKATLIAPFDGIVTDIYVDEGEVAAGRALNLVDVSGLEVVLSVDEIDIGQIEIGQPATVSFEAWPDAEVNSEVISIAPSATSTNSLINFDVNLALDDSDLPILIGMTANAKLITANLDEVLLIPNAALTADRDSGTYSVNVVNADGTFETVEVTIGLRDSDFTQIVDGIDEGMEVIIGEIIAPVDNQGFGPGNN